MSAITLTINVTIYNVRSDPYTHAILHHFFLQLLNSSYFCNYYLNKTKIFNSNIFLDYKVQVVFLMAHYNIEIYFYLYIMEFLHNWQYIIWILIRSHQKSIYINKKILIYSIIFISYMNILYSYLQIVYNLNNQFWKITFIALFCFFSFLRKIACDWFT